MAVDGGEKDGLQLSDLQQFMFVNPLCNGASNLRWGIEFIFKIAFGIDNQKGIGRRAI